MADSASSNKLLQLPWPVLVGVSLLLHAGALLIGLPTIVRVDTPPNNSIDIPVTLIDEGDIPTATPANPSPTVSIPQEPAAPLGGRNPVVEPRVDNQVTQPTPQPEITAKQPQTETPVTPETPVKPVTKPGSETPETPETPPVVNRPSDEGTETADSESGEGALSMSIVGVSTVPPGTPGDWPDVLPTLQSSSTLNISNHTCNDALPAGEVTLGLVIGADGSVIQTFAPPNQDSISAQTASCLLTHALSLDPSALQFTPAYTGQNPIATDRMQLTVRF
ncbi:MAG: hypothetical protein AAGI69_03560 [Cyanobacteria bacterium P01_H01_bin.21]